MCSIGNGYGGTLVYLLEKEGHHATTTVEDVAEAHGGEEGRLVRWRGRY